MKFVFLILLVFACFGTEPAVAQDNDIESYGVVVDPGEKSNKSRLEVEFSQPALTSDKKPLSFQNVGGWLNIGKVNVSSIPEDTRDTDVHGFFYPESDLKFVQEKNGTRRIVVPSYQGQSSLVELFKWNIIFNKHPQKNELGYEVTGGTIDEYKQWLRDNTNHDPDDLYNRWYEMFKWGDIEKRLFSISTSYFLDRTYKSVGQGEATRQYLVTYAAYSILEIEIPPRPSNFTVGTAVDYRNKVSRVVDVLRSRRSNYEWQLEGLQFPLGPEVSAQDAALKLQELRNEIDWQKRLVKENSPRWRGGRENDYLEPGNPEAKRRAEIRRDEAEAEYDAYRRNQLLPQLMAHLLRGLLATAISDATSQLNHWEAELQSVDNQLLALFVEIKDRSHGDISDYRRLFRTRVSEINVQLDAAGLHASPGRVLRSPEDVLGVLTKLHEDFSQIKTDSGLTEAMKEARWVSLFRSSGILDKGNAIHKSTFVPGQRNSDFSSAVASDALELFDRFFLISDEEIPVPSFLYTPEDRNTILEVWRMGQEYGSRLQMMTALFLLGHGFWDSELVAYVERVSLEENIFDQADVDRLVFGCFQSLAYFSQLEAIIDLERRRSRYSEQARRILAERMEIQNLKVLGRALEGRVDSLGYDEKVQRAQIEAMKAMYLSGRLEEARETLEALIKLIEGPHMLLHAIRELYAVNQVPDPDWELILSTTGNLLVGDLMDFEDQIDFNYEAVPQPSPQQINERLLTLKRNLAIFDFYLSDLSVQALVLRDRLEERARLLALIASIRLSVDGNRAATLKILTRLGGKLENESQMRALYFSYSPVFSRITELGVERQIGVAEVLALNQELEAEEQLELVQRSVDSSSDSLYELRFITQSVQQAESDAAATFERQIGEIIEDLKREVADTRNRIIRERP